VTLRDIFRNSIFEVFDAANTTEGDEAGVAMTLTSSVNLTQIQCKGSHTFGINANVPSTEAEDGTFGRRAFV